MYQDFKIDGYGFRVNERGWGIITDNYDGGAMELSISTMKKMIKAYEKEFLEKTNFKTSKK